MSVEFTHNMGEGEITNNVVRVSPMSITPREIIICGDMPKVESFMGMQSHHNN